MRGHDVHVCVSYKQFTVCACSRVTFWIFLWSCVNHSRNTDGADMNCCVCVCVCRLLTSDNFSSSQHHFIRVLIDTFMQYPVKKMLQPLISWRRPASGSRTCPASLQTEPPVASVWSCSSWWSLIRINSFLFKFYIDGFRRSGSDSEVTEICLCDFFGGANEEIHDNTSFWILNTYKCFCLYQRGHKDILISIDMIVFGHVFIP